MKTKHQNLMAWIFILFCVIIVFLLAYWSYRMEIQEIEREYYRDQMLIFCKLSEIYQGDLYPQTYPCERWLIGDDVR